MASPLRPDEAARRAQAEFLRQPAPQGAQPLRGTQPPTFKPGSPADRAFLGDSIKPAQATAHEARVAEAARAESAARRARMNGPSPLRQGVNTAADTVADAAKTVKGQATSALNSARSTAGSALSKAKAIPGQLLRTAGRAYLPAAATYGAVQAMGDGSSGYRDAFNDSVGNPQSPVAALGADALRVLGTVGDTITGGVASRLGQGASSLANGGSFIKGFAAPTHREQFRNQQRAAAAPAATAAAPSIQGMGASGGGTGTFQMQGGPLRTVQADGTAGGTPGGTGALNSIPGYQSPPPSLRGPQGSGAVGASISNPGEDRRRLEIALSTVGRGSPSVRKALMDQFGAAQERGPKFAADQTLQNQELAAERSIADQRNTTEQERNSILRGKADSDAAQAEQSTRRENATASLNLLTERAERLFPEDPKAQQEFLDNQLLRMPGALSGQAPTDTALMTAADPFETAILRNANRQGRASGYDFQPLAEEPRRLSIGEAAESVFGDGAGGAEDYLRGLAGALPLVGDHRMVRGRDGRMVAYDELTTDEKAYLATKQGGR